MVETNLSMMKTYSSMLENDETEGNTEKVKLQFLDLNDKSRKSMLHQ